MRKPQLRVPMQPGSVWVENGNLHFADDDGSGKPVEFRVRGERVIRFKNGKIDERATTRSTIC